MNEEKNDFVQEQINRSWKSVLNKMFQSEEYLFVALKPKKKRKIKKKPTKKK